MKILIAPAHYYLSDKKGTEFGWAYSAVKTLAEMGHEVTAIAGVSDLANRLPETVRLITIFGDQRSTDGLTELWRKVTFHFKVGRRVRQLLKAEKFDVVHHFAPVSLESPNIAAVRGYLGKLPFTMGPAMTPPDGRQDLDVAMGVKKNWQFRLTSVLVNIARIPANRLQQKTLARVDRLVAATSEAADYYGRTVSKKKITVIPPGINLNQFSIQAAKRDPYIILSVCYLIKRKGLDVLLQAFADLVCKEPRARLWIVGDGPERQNLEQLAKELGIQKEVRFWGFVENSHVGKYYAEAGVFATPTRHEPYGQTVLEAMAAGLPVVASATGGIMDILTPECGRTHPVDDQAALTAALSELVGNSELQSKLGSAGRERATADYSWPFIMQRYVDLWSELSNE